jgi:hypothetical protein
MTKLEHRRAGRHVSLYTAAVALFAACASPAPTDATPTPAGITIVSGSGQTGFTGAALSQPLVVKVTTADGTPLAGQTVDFTVTTGQATVNPASTITDANGLAQAQVTLGSTSGTVEVVATVHQTLLRATFQASVQPITSNNSCTTATTVTLAVGETRTALAGSEICLRTTAAAEYMVNGFFASSVGAAQTQVGITGFGITTATGSPASQSANSSLISSSVIGSGLSRGPSPARQLDLRMRNIERTVLAPRMASARSAMRRRGATLASAPPTVGQILQLNVDEGCNTPPRYRFGRVVAVTATAIVVADTGNPAGGFTDADYQSVGITFDTLVDPLDRAAFGDPSDIDGNSRSILFFTRAVNELTPVGSLGFIGGFFDPRDLFPRTDPDPQNACSGSNFAEMFYLLVPDPNGTINGHQRLTADVKKQTIGVTGHEYQHLINAARRIYVNTAATDFEEVWLNEGLSHVAEELLYYREAGLTPRQDIDSTSVRAGRSLNAVNAYQINNLDRYGIFLENPVINSPYADNDSLETRGATWSFLRYAADHQGTSDGTVWRQLVNSTTTGLANLTNVFGGPILNEFRDWSISVFTDDRVATAAAYQQPSWNFRTLLPLISDIPGPVAFSLSDGVQTTKTVSGGGSLYVRFGVAANVSAALDWSVPSASVQISIVRTK